MFLLVALIGAFIFGSWLYAVVNSLIALQHRKPDQSWFSFAWQGYKFYNPNNFTEAGKKYQRRFMYGVAGFVLGAMTLLALGFVFEQA